MENFWKAQLAILGEDSNRFLLVVLKFDRWRRYGICNEEIA